MFITKKSDLFVFIKMSTIEQLLEVLEEIAKIIQKTQINLKKCPKQRLTRGYIETRLKCLDEYWNKFTSTHQELIKSITRGKSKCNQLFCERRLLYM